MTERRPPHTWVTYALIAANVAMFGVELALGVNPIDPTAQQVLDAGANFGPLTTDGQWWRLVTAMFLHFGLVHIGLNMLCLWQGRVVETLFGRAPFAVLYLLAGLAGSVASLARAPFTVSAGASGAVFGVYGAFAAFLVFRRASLPADVWRTTARGIGMFIVINFIFGLSMPNIDMTAHVGGLVAGFVVGGAFLARGRDGRPGPGRTLAIGAAGLAIIIGGALAIPRPQDASTLLERFGQVESQTLEKAADLERRSRAADRDDARLAAELERDVLAPWRAARGDLEAADHLAPRFAPLVVALRDYAAARQRSWETFDAALHATGDDRQTRLDLHHVQDRVAQQAANVVQAELERLAR
ncbi:MAG: Rhomboid family protein [Deltaproteobacteria bacterium]|nr:Rhomboid family protein [Deltaproteobacteria bacterium]